MKVKIEYADNPEWDHVVKAYSWSDAISHVGCTATRLTVLSDAELCLMKADELMEESERITRSLDGAYLDDPKWQPVLQKLGRRVLVIARLREHAENA